MSSDVDIHLRNSTRLLTHYHMMLIFILLYGSLFIYIPLLLLNIYSSSWIHHLYSWLDHRSSYLTSWIHHLYSWLNHRSPYITSYKTLITYIPGHSRPRSRLKCLFIHLHSRLVYQQNSFKAYWWDPPNFFFYAW